MARRWYPTARVRRALLLPLPQGQEERARVVGAACTTAAVFGVRELAEQAAQERAARTRIRVLAAVVGSKQHVILKIGET